MSDNRSIDSANGERVGQLGDPGKLKLMSRHGRFPGHAGSYSDNVIYHRPLSRRLDRCDRVIHNESGDPNGGNMCSFSGATCTSSDVTMQITFLTRKSALIYRRDLRQRVASLTLNCNGVLAIRAYEVL